MDLILIDFLPQVLILSFGLLKFKDLKIGYKLILIQVLLSVVVDLIAIFYRTAFGSNEIIYNFYIIVESILIISAVFAHTNEVNRIYLFQIPIVLYLIASIILLSVLPIYKLNYPLLILGFILISIANLYLLISPQTEKSFIKNPMMFIALGHLIYFLGVTPYYVGRQILLLDNPIMNDFLFGYINMTLALFRYSLLAFAFFSLMLNKSQITAPE